MNQLVDKEKSESFIAAYRKQFQPGELASSESKTGDRPVVIKDKVLIKRAVQYF